MSLTKRQTEIVELVARGNTAQEIADQLCRALPTVRRHLQIACEHEGARNAAHLVALSISRGFIKALCLFLVVSLCNGHIDGIRRNAPKRMTQRFEAIPAIVI